MESIHGMHKASKFEPEDFISNMPDNVVANIMDRLPLQYAVRTSILARYWRSKWNLLSQIVCDQDFYSYLAKKREENSLCRIIILILHHLKGPITKFVLSCKSANIGDIIHIVLCLSKKEIKDLTIYYNYNGQPLNLPIYLFSCLELKHLKLYNCCFDPPTSFHGFPNLLSLEINYVQFKRGKFLELCPELENLTMFYPYQQTIKVKPVEIGKLANLKILSLFMSNLDNTGLSSIFELLDLLPELQELDLDFTDCKITEDGAKNCCTTIFPCIKTLKLQTINLGNGVMLSFAFEMIKSFPNLKNLELKASERGTVPTPGYCFPELEWLQLCNLVFRDLKGSENEVCLIKYLVTCSPFLKKVGIHPHSRLAPGEQLSFAGKLLKLQRAYPIVEINL